MDLSLVLPVVCASVLITALIFFVLINKSFPGRLPLGLFGFGAAAALFSLFDTFSNFSLIRGRLTEGLFWNYLSLVSVFWILPTLPQLALLVTEKPRKKLLVNLTLGSSAVMVLITLGFFFLPDLFASPLVPKDPQALLGSPEFGMVRTGPGFLASIAVLWFCILTLMAFYVYFLFRQGKFQKRLPFFLCLLPAFLFGCDDLQNTFTGTFVFFSGLEFSRYSTGAAIFTLSLLLVLFWSILREAREKVFTERQLELLKDEWNRLPYLDALTELPNRKSMDARFDDILARAKRDNDILGIFLIDLDHLKNINDGLGHSAGDEAIRRTAQILKDLIRANDALFRMDGDEMAVVITNLKDPADSGVVAQKMLNAVQKPWTWENRPLYQSISIGIALYPRDGSDKFTLIQQADLALAQAKKDRNTFRFSSRELNDQAQNKVTLLQELREALDSESYEVHYQPLVNPKGKVAGAEALLRVNLPLSGRVSPEIFIPLAETSGLINAIGQWVVDQVLKDHRVIEAAGHDVYLSVNLSAKQLQDPAFLPKLEEALKSSGISPKKIHLEITETAYMEKGPQTMETLAVLHKRGIPLVLDDFGVGYSSLSYLKNLPVHTLKIDKSFIQTLPHNKRDAVLVRSIIEMAQGLNLHVVAEGVESREQRDFLIKHNVNFIQGFIHSRPLPLDRFLAYLAQQNSPHLD